MTYEYCDADAVAFVHVLNTVHLCHILVLNIIHYTMKTQQDDVSYTQKHIEPQTCCNAVF